MAHDVFISHSSQDKHVADAVCAALEARKVRCWIAPRDVVAGMRWGEAIVQGINESRVMVLVLSGNSNASHQVMSEVERGVSKGIPILPFRIEDVEPSAGLELFIMGRHWLDAMTPPLERHLGQLCDAVASLLSLRPGEAAAPVPGDPAIHSAPSVQRTDSGAGIDGLARRLRSRPFHLGALAAALGVVALIAALFFLPDDPKGEAALRAPALLHVLNGHGDDVSSLAFSPDGKRLLSCSYDGSLRTWDPSSGKEVKRYDSLGSACLRAEFIGPRRALFSTEHSGAGIIDLESGSIAAKIDIPNGAEAIAVSADGKQAVVGESNGYMALYDMTSGRQIRALDGHSDNVYSVAITPDGKRALSSGADRTVSLWDLDTGDELRRTDTGSNFVYAVSLSRDGKLAAWGTSAREIVIWDVERWQMVWRLIRPDVVTSVDFLPDDKRVAYGLWGGEAGVWETATTETIKLLGHTNDLLGVAVSPDGKLMASGGNDTSIRIWSLK